MKIQLKRLRPLLLILLAISFFAFEGHAQFSKNKSAVTGQKFKIKKKKRYQGHNFPINYINNTNLILGFGTSTYYGELTDDLGDSFKKISPTFTLGLGYRYSSHWQFRGQLDYFNLKGTDEGGKNAKRNLSFTSRNVDFSVQAAYDFFHFRKLYRRRKKIAPYAFVGLGFIYYNPIAQYDGENFTLKDYKTEEKDYSSLALTIPFGAGLRFSVIPHLEIGTEVTYTLTTTDYLDDVSTTYTSTLAGMSETDIALSDRRVELGYNTKAGTGKKRGNPESNDGYFFFQIKAFYTFKVNHQRYNINSNVSRFRTINNVKKKR